MKVNGKSIEEIDDDWRVALPGQYQKASGDHVTQVQSGGDRGGDSMPGCAAVIAAAALFLFAVGFVIWVVI